jgi:hypothetical protein
MPRKNRSSPISYIRYNEDTGTLDVAFSDGSAYSYSNVPEEVYQAFEHAPSQGSYFNANIRGTYG